VTRFVELSCAFEDVGLRREGNLPGARLTAPSYPFAFEAGASPLQLAAIADLPGLVVDAAVPPHGLVVAPAPEVVRDRAVLIRTGCDRQHPPARGARERPYLAETTVTALLAGGAALVGVDFPSIDAPRSRARTARTRLLSAGIVVVEGLWNLSALPAEGFRFFAVPLQSGASTPVRAFAELLPP
jgi:arylformamidase